MKKIVSLLPFFCFIFSYAQVSTETYDSYKLLEERNLRIYIPENYSEEKVYPLFVVLDAEYIFENVVSTSKFYSYWQEMPDAIIVGIDQNYSNIRYEDCHYSDENGFPDEKGNLFFEFIGMELIPHLETKYNIAPFKLIVGHGLTGNFINYYLFKNNPLFSGYINLSPELAPEMENQLPDRLSALESKIFYYLAVCKTEHKLDRERNAILMNHLKSVDNESLNYYCKDFDTIDEVSVVSYAIPQALNQMFKIFKPITPKEYKEKILKLDTPVFAYLEEKYDDIENLFGFRKTVSLNDIMAIYAASKKKEELESLEKLAELCKKQYPETMMGFYFQGEYLEQKGEPKKALRAYEKAFGMKEIDFLTKDMAIDKIDALKADFGW